MKVKNQFRKLVKEMNATVVRTFDPYDHCWVLEVEAPDGKRWSEGPTILIGYLFTYPRDSEEVYEDLINRMNSGLDDEDINT